MQYARGWKTRLPRNAGRRQCNRRRQSVLQHCIRRTFTDYGPRYSAFSEGLDGGFDGSAAAEAKPLPVLFSADLERTLRLVEDAGAKITRPIFDFPGGRRFHFADPAGNELAVWAE